MARVENKVVLLSGGASGIGAATARLVVREGGKAVLADRDEAKGRALAEELGEAARVHAARRHRRGSLGEGGGGDGRDLRRPARAAECRGRRRAQLDRGLHARGIPPGQRRQLDGHVPRLQARDPGDGKIGGGGSIVNISSVLGLRGASYAMAYCASKGAVRSLTKNVALHCAQMKYGIRCNSVHPGYIDTPMIAPRLSARRSTT